MSDKHTIFNIKNEQFALHADFIRSIEGMLEVTTVPGMPAFVKGVVNLRGKIVPVIDLRIVFGVEPREDIKKSYILVSFIDSKEVGIVVDEVTNVTDILETSIEPFPEAIETVKTQSLSGIVNMDGQIITVIDLNKLLDQTSKQLLSSIQE